MQQPEEEDEAAAYEPADGDYVKITDADDEVVEGTITGLTSKKITIEDAEGEEHGFILAKVTVEAATKPKGKAKAAAKEKEAPVKTGAATKSGKAAAGDDDGW